MGLGRLRVRPSSPVLGAAATRQRVIAAIGRLGYQPNPIARAFGGRRTDRLEVLVPALTESFALELLRGIQDALGDTDYTLLMRTVDDAAERERAFAECCRRGRTEGAIVLSS